MTSDKKSVSLLADLFIKKGLTHIVISPGSRNAPVVTGFAGRSEINAVSIVDERSAAYFALGMAQQQKRAVAITCTSGTAPLNYAPAVAEAYYQKVPLLILTADRPPELIDVGDGQTIRQKDVFKNYIKAGFELPENIDSPAAFDLANKIINRAIDLAHYPEPGPVHINLPFSEPLYNTTNEIIEGTVTKPSFQTGNLSESYISSIAEEWNKFDRILLIAGQQHKNRQLNDVLSELVTEKNVVLLTETTSNLYNENFVGCIDNVLTTITEKETDAFKPGLLVTFGGQVVSKKIKRFLRNRQPKEHWHISPSGEAMDTYKCLNKVIKAKPDLFFKQISGKLKKSNPDFATLWIKRRNKVIDRREDFLAGIEYSDLQVFDMLLRHIPTGTILHLGNSTPVRYAQLFGTTEFVTCHSNRGVSGIDGQVSTAAGAAYVSNKTNLLITGDLGFFYDSNGLMNQNLPSNLKIIVINNGGGGIFRFIPGPDQSPYLEPFFETKHNWSVKNIAETFDVTYIRADSVQEILYALPEFFNQPDKPALMEIFTPGATNAQWLKRYFNHLQH
jgi:2-succinyl-5-enolpyruvyl-6-hydroxy-3-cyclohexene-1-carboxylate synthase